MRNFRNVGGMRLRPAGACIRHSVAICAAAASMPALAQSSVTLYGIVDVELGHQNGVASASGSASKTAMLDGFATGSRFGFRGVEDLGGGYQALFTLENGFNSFSGTIAQQGQLFGRQAWVGFGQRLSGAVQTLTFGRQYGSAFQVLSPYDSLYWGNQPTVVWPITLAGVRFDNSIQYKLQSDRWLAIGQYSVGGQTTGNMAGSTIAVGARYSGGGWSVGSELQQSRDGADQKMRYGAIGASVDISQVNLHGVYMVSLRDPNFTVGTAGTTNALANTNIVSNRGNATTRRDEVFDVGATVNVTPWLIVLAAFEYDRVTSASSLGQGGTLKTGYLMVDYLLSKATDVYAEVDYTRLSGYEKTDPSTPSGTFGGTASHTAFAVGLRKRF